MVVPGGAQVKTQATWLSKLALVFNVRSEESRLVFLMLAHSFFVGMAQILVSTTAGTLFLGNFTAHSLPYVYVGSAVLNPLVGLLFSKLEGRLSFTKFLTVNLSLLFVALITFRLLFFLPEAGWGAPALALYIWYYVQDVLINLEFWSLAGRLFNVRQGKRLFGLIGAGEMVARVISGFSVRPLVRVIGTPNLLFLASGGIACSMVLMLYIIHRYPPDDPTSKTDKELAQGKRSYRELIKNRYIILMAGLAIFALLGYFFVDLAFLSQARAAYPDRDELAGFLGTFFAVIGILGLLSRLFLTGPLISRYGLVAGLLALPVMVSVGTVSMAMVGTIAASAVAIFWAAGMTKLLFITFRKSTDRSASRILYQPLPAGERLRVQTGIENIVEPVASGIAGVILLLLPFGAVQLSYILLAILAIWIAIVILLGREYMAVLMRALNQRSLGQFSFSMVDASSMAILRKGLESPYPGEVIYFLDVLEGTEHQSLGAFLVRLLSHSAPEVRQDVLRRIERLGMTSALRQVSARVKLEALPHVRGTALRTMAALGETEVFEQILPYVEDPEPPVRLGAMVGLLRSGGIEGILVAGENLIELSRSPDPAQRRFAAQLLGEVGITNFYRPLIKLLQDGDPWVRQAALAAAGKLKNPQLWPLVIQSLATPRVRAAAVSALIAGGEAVIPCLTEVFIENGQPRETLIRAAQICGRVRGEAAIALLRDRIDFPDADVRYHVLASLRSCGYKVQGTHVSRIEQEIRSEVGGATWTLAAIRDLGEGEPVSLLANALNRKLERHREQIFWLLSFIYDDQSVMNAWDILNMDRSSGERRAYALEIIDLLVAQELKAVLLPLLDDLRPVERLRRLSDFFPQPAKGPSQWLEEIVTGSNGLLTPWVKTCALWALAGLDPARYHRYLGELRSDPDPQAAYVLGLLETDQSGDRVMLSTIEKVIILKTVNIFSETPDEVLAEVAFILDEVEVKADETIFEKGDMGHCLYVIVEGQARVHDAERTFAYLEDRDIFGEMSILDTQPRSASVTATADTRLLRLEQDLFSELMTDRIEVAQGIIRMLTHRLREMLLEQVSHLEQKPKKAKEDVMESIYQTLVNL